MEKTVIVALGGNAILQPKQRGTAEEQFENIIKSCKQIAQIIKKGYKVVITHGNGPQVGNILLQQEAGINSVPAMPLDICGAMSQGQIGYMIQQSLRNELKKIGIFKEVVTLITQVLIDEEDQAFKNPTKPVGPFFDADHAKKTMEETGQHWVEDSGRGWRRVVPSPDPKGIIEKNLIKNLVDSGAIVITSGGGGIPVIYSSQGDLQGVEAVIDKDLAGCRLAMDLKADILMILTDVPYVAINYGKENQENLKSISLKTMENYAREGHFKAGSMGPKVEAALRFIKNGGEKSIITSLDTAIQSLEGNNGTIITP